VLLCCIYWTYELCSLTCTIVCFSVGCYSDVIASYTTGCTSLLSVEYSQSNTLVCVGVTWSYEHHISGQDEIVCAWKSSAVCKLVVYVWMYVIIYVCMFFFSWYLMQNIISSMILKCYIILGSSYSWRTTAYNDVSKVFIS
jgi:hypothetical protein